LNVVHVASVVNNVDLRTSETPVNIEQIRNIKLPSGKQAF